jgi:hypothetical protein
MRWPVKLKFQARPNSRRDCALDLAAQIDKQNMRDR